MMPIVFCASLAPCIRLKPAADTSCMRRKKPSTRRGLALRNTHRLPTISSQPTLRPISGAMTMKTIVLVQPDTITAENPALATAAPA